MMGKVPGKNNIKLLVTLLVTISLVFGFGCGKKKSHLSEYQEWIDFNAGVRDVMYAYTEAFYREYQRLPSSLEEFKASKWYLMEPIAPDFARNFELVDRPLGSYDDDGDKVQVSFTETGLTYVYYYRDSEEGGQPHKYNGLTKGNVISNYDGNIQSDIDSAQFDVTNIKYVRQNLIYAVSRLLVRRYVEFYQAPPPTASALFKNRWEPNGAIFSGLETIAEGNPHACYTGVTIVDGEAVLYIELMKQNGEPFIEQRVYNISVMGNTTGVAETLLEEEKHVERSETEAIFDSSVMGWGVG